MDTTNPNSTVNTSCKNCCFAVFKDKTQLGCLQNRIEKFGESVTGAYDNDKEFYVINRFCNYYRDRAWGYTEADVDKVRLESANKYCIFVDCNHINDTAESTLNYIRHIDYYDDKIEIVFFHDAENFNTVKDTVAYIARNCNQKVNISVLSDNLNNFLHDYVKKSNAFFHCVLKNLTPEGLYFADKINSFINEDLGKCIAIEYGGNVFINNHIYKAVSFLNECRIYKDVIKTLIEESHKLNRYIKL